MWYVSDAILDLTDPINHRYRKARVECGSDMKNVKPSQESGSGSAQESNSEIKKESVLSQVIEDKGLEERTRHFGERLVAVGQHRDQVAFADIYSYYAGRVKSFLLSKGMNEDTSEELMQEIMLSVWRRAETYDPAKAAASTWIFTIARNRRIDFLRGNSRVEVELDDELLEIETTEPNQEQQLEHEQDAQTLQNVMAVLPDEQRQVLHLSFFRGQSHGAIANWLDLPVGTVKSRIRLAMQSMRGQLQQKGETR
ncbi:MAG: sigma-70 family RNA polymerase sigma factor [Granulosicoccus sp.]|nr:sigma-70 family RNA polymerase sigma factor [Granulosicoccus sp.]